MNRDFDEEIKNMLIIHTLADVSSNLIYSTNVSAAFRYEDIKNAAEKVQLSPDWKLDPKIKDLKFSNHWVAKFLKRVNFSRKKITSTTSIALSDVAVRETNEMIKGLGKGKIVFNMDETGVFLARPSHVYCEKSQKIIKSLFKDSKKRFTVALTVSSTGEFLPLLFILGSNAKRMKNYFEEFQKNNGFGINDGWKIVTRSETDDECFLQHEKKRHIITYNSSAWMNAHLMQLYADNIFHDEAHKNSLLIMDNFSAHKDESVKNILNNKGISHAFLFPGSTGVSQPLDVYVNSQLKANLKKKFCTNSFDHLLNYKKESFNLYVRKNKVLPFIPKEQSISETVLDVIDIVDREFNNERFKKGVNKAFMKAGLIDASLSEAELNVPNIDFSISEIVAQVESVQLGEDDIII